MVGAALGGETARAGTKAGCAPEGPALSAWLAEWDSVEDVAQLGPEVGTLGALWVRSLTLAPDARAVTFAETPAMQALRAAAAHARGTGRPRYGPVLHNGGPEGFDAELGRRLLGDPDPVLIALARLARRERWQSLNVDLESLPPEQAAPFERFLERLSRVLGPRLHLSVALHPRTSDREDYQGAAFQRWRALARHDVDFVIMGYDHAWSTSPPGPVAPLTWLLDVAAYATATLPRARVVFALPLYGYAWRRTSAPGAAPAPTWQGTPALAPALRARVEREPGWRRDDTLAPADGALYRRAEDEAIAFDDVASVQLKMEALAAAGIDRFALWRLGARISLGPFRPWADRARRCPPVAKK